MSDPKHLLSFGLCARNFSHFPPVFLPHAQHQVSPLKLTSFMLACVGPFHLIRCSSLILTWRAPTSRPVLALSIIIRLISASRWDESLHSAPLFSCPRQLALSLLILGIEHVATVAISVAYETTTDCSGEQDLMEVSMPTRTRTGLTLSLSDGAIEEFSKQWHTSCFVCDVQ